MKRKIYYLIYAILGAAVLIYLIKLSIGLGDFRTFLNAAKNLKEGTDIYFPPIDKSVLQYFYSPLFAVLLIPFSCLPFWVGSLIWQLFSCFCFYRIFIILLDYIDYKELSKKQLNWLPFLVLIFNFRTIQSHFAMVQMTIFLLWVILETLHLSENKKFLLAGALLALGINIKILPVVLIPYLIYRANYRTVVYAILFFGLYLVLPALYLGFQQNIDVHKEWFHVLNPTKTNYLDDATSWGVHSVDVLIMSLFMDLPYQFNYKRNILSLDFETVQTIIRCVQFILIAIVLFFVKWPPFKPVQDKLQKLREISYLCLVIPLIFPHQQKYAFLLLIPASVYLFYYLLKTGDLHSHSRKRNSIIIFMCISFILITLTTDGLIGRHLNLITQYYKTITYGTIILILPLALANPKDFSDNPKNQIS